MDAETLNSPRNHLLDGQLHPPADHAQTELVQKHARNFGALNTDGARGCCRGCIIKL